jgi:hypothetical protein
MVAGDNDDDDREAAAVTVDDGMSHEGIVITCRGTD